MRNKLSQKPVFKSEHECAQAEARLKDLKDRLKGASQNRVSGLGLAPLYKDMRVEISTLEAKIGRYKATKGK